MPVIDADAHVIENDQTWQYMNGEDSRYRPVSVSAHGDGREFWLIDGRVFEKHSNVNLDIPEASREMHGIERRLRHMDELQIDIQVLYTTFLLKPFTKKPEVEVALAKSYNRWVAEVCAKAKGRLRWVGVLPLLDMAGALAEAKFAKENGACGLFTHGIVHGRLLSDPYFYPLYEEAVRLNMPICVHASAGGFGWWDFFEKEGGFAKFKFPVVSAFHSLIYDGVTEMFPKLRFGFIEVRAQWIPYVIVDLIKRLEGKKGKAIGKDIMRQKQLYVACQTDDDLLYILNYSGEDRIMIGSDYGHVDMSAEIDALRKLKQYGEIKPEVIDKILCDNPKTFYGF